MSSARHEPTPEQRAAITNRDRDVFCEAGAGTGKTRVLVERYCAAVDEDDVGPESILAFTFTERAAAELRSRIRRELSGRAAEARAAGDEARATWLGSAARDTERAWVTTIHGFCRRLLAAHPAAAGIDPRFRVLDETEARRLRNRARDAAIDDLLADGDRDRTQVAAAYQPWRLGEMAVVAHGRLRSQGVAEPALPPVPDPVRSIRDPERDDPQLAPAEREGALRAHATLGALLAVFHRRYEELKAERAGLDFADLELRALGLLRSSAAIAGAWRERFVHVMVDEFQDTNVVQLGLIEALRGPETRLFRVGDELQSIYRFRNADLAVFRSERRHAHDDGSTLIQPLTGNFRSRPGVLAAVNLLGRALVGDGFRELAHQRADGDAANSAHPADPADSTATGSGRPVAELLLTPDDGRAKGWAEHSEALGGPPSEGQAKIVAEARALARRLRELVDAGSARPGEIVVLLRAFTHVDAYEEALERAGLDPYVVGGRGYWSQQQVEDVLRLLSALANPLDDEMLLGALAGPACGVSPDALWLLRQASVAESGPPQHLWPLVEWRYGASERRPAAVTEPWLEAVPSDDATRLGRFCSQLAELRAAAPTLPLDELVERTMTEFGYDLALLARRGGRGRMANVRKLIRLAREFEAHEGRDLRAFLTAAEELTARDEREGMAATQAEDHDGVRIMTVHAAKGLEFGVVAVPDLGRGLAQGERAGDLVIGRLEPGGEGGASGEDGETIEGAPTARFGLRLALPDADSLGTWELHELHAESRVEAAEEGCRLVHVAATRAEERLILSATFRARDAEPGDPEPGDTPVQRLLRALTGLGWDPEHGDGELDLEPAPPATDAEPASRTPRLAVVVNRPSAERAAQLAERLEPAARIEAEEEASRHPPLERPSRIVPVGHLSYSALAEYERCAYRFYIERMLGLSAEPAAGFEPADGTSSAPPRERRLAIGNSVHAALEWSARHRWDSPPDDLLEALAGEHGLDRHARAIEEVRALTDGWLRSGLRRGLDGAAVRAEVPFAISLAGTIVRGQIDLLVSGAEPTVVDYKTDALGGADPGDLGTRYAVQRKLYALAAAAASGDGAPPARVRAVHCFLEAPDDPVETTFDPAGLAAARSHLERLIGEIRHSDFEPTAEPTWQVCNGCPAAARLCPHPAWKPPRPHAGRAPEPRGASAAMGADDG